MSPDARRLKTIEDLIARAAHPNTGEHEARNAAFQACRLIQEHGFRVVTNTDYGTLQRQRPAIPVVDISLEDLAKQGREGIADEVTGIAERFAKDGFRGVVDWFQDAKEIKAHAKFRATKKHICAHCLAQIRPGDEVVVELGERPKGQRRITCTKEPCVKSWTGL